MKKLLLYVLFGSAVIIGTPLAIVGAQTAYQSLQINSLGLGTVPPGNPGSATVAGSIGVGTVAPSGGGNITATGTVTASSATVAGMPIAGPEATLAGLASLGFPSTWTYNPGGATVTISQANNGVVLYEPNFNADNINAICRSAPATPYTFEGKFTLTQDWLNGDSWGGFAWNSTAGAFMAYGLLAEDSGTPHQAGVFNLDFSNPTTLGGSTDYFGMGTAAPTIWLAISDDGTNAYWYFSNDGVNWFLGQEKALSATYLGASGLNNVCLFLSANLSNASLLISSITEKNSATP